MPHRNMNVRLPSKSTPTIEPRWSRGHHHSFFPSEISKLLTNVCIFQCRPNQPPSTPFHLPPSHLTRLNSQPSRHTRTLQDMLKRIRSIFQPLLLRTSTTTTLLFLLLRPRWRPTIPSMMIHMPTRNSRIHNRIRTPLHSLRTPLHSPRTPQTRIRRPFRSIRTSMRSVRGTIRAFGRRLGCESGFPGGVDGDDCCGGSESCPKGFLFEPGFVF